jgi:hypothetical protein
MKVKFETVSPTPVGGTVNMSVEFDLPDGASSLDVETATRAALDVHHEVAQEQQAWVEEWVAANPQPVMQPVPNRDQRRKKQ